MQNVSTSVKEAELSRDALQSAKPACSNQWDTQKQIKVRTEDLHQAFSSPFIPQERNSTKEGWIILSQNISGEGIETGDKKKMN